MLSVMLKVGREEGKKRGYTGKIRSLENMALLSVVAKVIKTACSCILLKDSLSAVSNTAEVRQNPKMGKKAGKCHQLELGEYLTPAARCRGRGSEQARC